MLSFMFYIFGFTYQVSRYKSCSKTFGGILKYRFLFSLKRNHFDRSSCQEGREYASLKTRDLLNSYYGLLFIRSCILSETDMFPFVCRWQFVFIAVAVGFSVNVSRLYTIETVSPRSGK